jgi:hypothetical protein
MARCLTEEKIYLFCETLHGFSFFSKAEEQLPSCLSQDRMKYIWSYFNQWN